MNLMKTKKRLTESLLMDKEIEVRLVGGKMVEDAKNATTI